MDRLTFFDRCASLDWNWHYADNYSQPHIQRAKQEQDTLRWFAGRHADLLPIYNAWADYANSGDAFGTLKAPRPSRVDAEQIPGQTTIFDFITD